MSEIEIEYPHVIQEKVEDMFKDAKSWHSMEIMDHHLERREDDPPARIWQQLKHDFMVDYANAHRGMPHIDQVQCLVMRVRRELCSKIKREINDQIALFIQTFDPANTDADGVWVRHYAKNKQKRDYQYVDLDDNSLLTHTVEIKPIKGDKNHCYMAVFMHPDLRSLVSAALLQQEVRARA